MRKIFKSVIILLVGICLSVNLNAQSLTTGLVAYYKMDEASDSVLDAVGYLKGFSNGATANQSGKLGTSYSFDGTNDYIEIPRKSTYILDQEGCGIAMSVWIYPTVTTGYREIVTKLHEVGTNTSPYFSYQLSLFPASTGLSPRFSITTNGTNKYAYNNSIVVIPNQWNHIVGTYDCATMNLYLNGTLVATSSASGSITNFDEPLYIGATGAETEVFQGRIDEIGIWSRNLSSGDVSYLYNGGDGITYPFNETPEEDPVECEVDLAYLFENNVADSGTLNINGVLKGGATYSTSGDSYEGDYSLRLTSIGQTLERRLISAAPVNLSSGNGLTVSLWAKIENTGFYPALFMNKPGSLNSTGITLGTIVATREVFLSVANGSSENSIITSASAYTFGEWTHFLFRFMDEDAQYANIWINGVLATEADSSLSITNWGKNDTICIGGYRSIDYAFTGNIDNVQIYKKALSEESIQELYENGATFYKVGCDTVPVYYVMENDLNDVIWFNTVYNVPEREVPGNIGSPIGIHPSNPRYFIYNNEPKVVVTSGEHYGAVLNTDFDYITYLNTIQEDGLNGTRISIGTAVEYQGWYNILQNTWAPAPGKYLCPWARSSITTGGYYGSGNKFDLSDWDEVYFQRLKDFVAAAQEREIFVEVMLFSAVYSDDLWNYSPFKASNNIQGIGPSTRTNLLNLSHSATTNVQKAVVAKIVTELNSYNNVWYEICNEPYLGNASNAWQDTILSTIRKTELTLPKRHLVSRNVTNYYSNISPTLSPDIDIWNFHYAREARAYIDNLDLNKIIGNNETGFTQADSQYRREAYVALFSGAGLFNNLDYSFTVNDETGQVVPTGNPAGGGPTLRKQLGHLRNWIQSFNFIEMSPSHSSITGLSSGTSGYCLKKEDDSHLLIFIRGTDGTFSVDLPSGEYSQSWFNTKTGSITQSFFTHLGGTKSFAAPSYTEDISLSVIKLSELPEVSNFDIYYEKTFEGLSTGPFNSSYLGTIYKQYNVDLATIEDDVINGVSTKALRVRNPADESPLYLTGDDALEIMPVIGSYDDVYISYRVRFDTNAPSTEGGKLFGAAGIPVPVTGSTSLTNSFKIRNAFKSGGTVTTYYHNNTTGAFDTRSTYPPNGTNTLFMNPGNWYDVTMRLVMNSSPSTSDGVWECWVNGKLLYSYNDRKYYYSTPTGNNNKIRLMSISNFYGGATDNFYPPEETYTQFDDLTVWNPKVPTAVGRNLHSPSFILPRPTDLGPQTFVYDSLITSPQTLHNTEYGSNYSFCQNETYMVDAGEGNTVTFNYTYDIHVDIYGFGDYLLIYDGNTTDSPLLKSSTGTGTTSAQSTGRYMFIRFVTNKQTNRTGFTGSLTFNSLLARNIAHDQAAVVDEGIEVNDYVVNIIYNQNYNRLKGNNQLTYYKTGGSNNFDVSLNGGYIYCINDNPSPGNYTVKFKIEDATNGIADTATCYITVVDSSDCIYVNPLVSVSGTGTKASPYKSLMNVTWGNKNVFVKRGTQDNLTDLTKTVISNSNNLVGAYGSGARPILANRNGQAGNNKGVFTLTGNISNVTIRDVDLYDDDDQLLAVVYSVNGYTQQNMKFDNCIIRGGITGEVGDNTGTYQGMRLDSDWNGGGMISNCDVFGVLADGIYCHRDLTGSISNYFQLESNYVHHVDYGYDGGCGGGQAGCSGDPFDLGPRGTDATTDTSINADKRYLRIANNHAQKNFPKKHGILYGGTIYPTFGRSYAIIEENYVRMAGGVYNGYGSAGISLYGAKGAIVRYNVMENSVFGIYSPNDSPEYLREGINQDIQVYGNLIYNTYGFSIFLQSNCDNWDIWNNTTANWGLETGYQYRSALTLNGASSVDFRNNILVASSVATTLNPFYNVSGLTEDYNLIYPALNGWTKGAHTIVSDPLFVTGENSEYEIGVSSPAYHGGVDLNIDYDLWGDTFHPTTPSIGYKEKQ